MKNPAVVEATADRAAVDYALGDLTIKVGSVQVLRGRHEIALPRLSFDLLLALVRAAPNVVTIDELMTLVWPGLVVGPETVSQRIKLLRAALDDEARKPRYIAGVRGRGYRIVASVNVVDGAETAPAQPQHVPDLRKRSRFLWAGAIAASLLIALLIVWRQRPDSGPQADLPDRSVAVLPFENRGNSPEDAALAFGVAETLLHRLASFKDLVVIARRSSFTFDSGDDDVRDIGRKLNARYLVEGSLQSDKTRLRITAQLIDATDGSHVWSMQFDRKPQDIFTIQDEIASKVAQAMQLTVSGGARTKSGTQDFDAYLAYSQARSRLATGRVADMKLAIAELERAIRLDPRFADAYVSLARAVRWVAESDVNEERRSNIESAMARARELLEHARSIDDTNPDVYFERGLLIEDPALAEAEFRQGLELNPNSALGYARLSELLWWTGKRNESIAAIDRARQLDPLELEYDNSRARAALYARSDVRMAEELSLKVLERDPSSRDALMRLGEVYWCCRNQFAHGAKYLEQAFEADPGNEFGLRMLMRAYLDMNDAAEAGAIAMSAPHTVSARDLAVLLYRHDWLGAGERAYDSAKRATDEAIDDHLRALAVRMHASAIGDYTRAREFLESRAFVAWSADGVPQITEAFEEDYGVALAEVLIRVGERERAGRLLQLTLSKFDYEAHQLGRGEMWYLRPTAMALALLGRDDEALAMLQRALDVGFCHDSWAWIDIEPAYDRLRALPRFKALVEQADRIAVEQRAELERMRAARLITYRTPPGAAQNPTTASP